MDQLKLAELYVDKSARYNRHYLWISDKQSNFNLCYMNMQFIESVITFNLLYFGLDLFDYQAGYQIN